MADSVTSATKCRYFLAGGLVGASSSAVVYMFYRKASANQSHIQTTKASCESDVGASSPATRSAEEVPGEEAPCSDADTLALTQVQALLAGKGVTLIVSSALKKAIFLAQGAKTAGLNIVRSEGFDDTDDDTIHVFGKGSSFVYGKSTFRSERDIITGKTFSLQKLSSEIAVTHPRRETVAARSCGSGTGVPPLSEIFPFSVLNKMGICEDPYFREEDEETQTCSSATVSKTTNGKCVRVIRSRHRESPTSGARSVDVGGDMGVVQTYPPGFSRVWRLGSDFHDLYHTRYDTYHGIVQPNPTVVLYTGHS
ncbi:uncharacterized protein [Haliotis cracherodii]|uniref:uncharacterized protein n=1 Tax=Haliotis cracherodii TaxID=6455 RepID=UPI0039E7E1FD